ncbi:hypothetical protein KP003_05290 [Geomonas nitrogeniifigens]|uniref:hypothetical protein n=1 Tax=Geomonas diazotrophica TaxID=2843197 RepID=UPI001C2C7EC8|nr:hypothetical protein [Geomonas nitrogeniifigens]QXE87819.1 hypothetical protein KP003_05290 [Geomonas nitrogeniifigens]
MATLFHVESTDIVSLNDIQLTRLLKMLLHLEARAAGITERAVEVALNITVADGGEDGRIRWNADPQNTDFLPSCFVQFQNKATYMPPAECGKEILRPDGSIKPMVENALGNGASYVIFHNFELNQQQKEMRIENIRETLRHLAKPYADTATIDIYDAAKITGWVNKYIAAIVAVLNWVGRPLERGLKTWEDWSKHREYQSFPFVGDEDRSRDINSLRTLLAIPTKCARIIGLSGLGKTRLALEIFRNCEEHDDLSERVVYVDSGANPGILGLVTDWVQCRLEGIVVVDNCDISLHEKLRREIQRTDSKLSLLTLDYNFDRANQTAVVQVKQMSDEHIKQMLEPVYGDRISDLDRIISFAQGFPQMAVLLADARLEQEPEMGRLSDDDLAHKMLWGGRDYNDRDERILKGCALFDRFGLDDEASPEFQFIAQNIVEVDLDQFFDCIKRFEERGLIDRRGRYAKLVPKPLAIRLAAEWWRRTRPERQMALVNSQMPGSLLESFCDQVARLDFLPEVKALTEGLCGSQSPFGQAEVILSDRGSRLFRSFVEVNPEATSKALHETLKTMTEEELVAIDGDVRRNLVWALEKLCFHEACFEESAHSLLLLAAAENESWSNNATGLFKQLFRSFLSGTEANPDQRLSVIDFALSTGKDVFMRLAIGALDKVIDTHGGSRMLGAEYQGSGEPLKEWKPKVWGEVYNYWEQALVRLCRVVEEGGSLASEAKDAIAHNIRGLMMNGRVSILDTAINTVVAAQGPVWPQALENIKDSLRYEGGTMPAEGKAKLEEWIGILTPSDLAQKLSLLVTNAPFEHEALEDGHYVDVAAENAKGLAVELASELVTLLPHIDNLVTGEQRQSYLFGLTLVQAANRWEPVLTQVIQATESASTPNLSLLQGILTGIFQNDAKEWKAIVEKLYDMDNWKKFYPQLLTSGQADEKQLLQVVELIATSKIPAAAANIFSYGRPLEHLTHDSVCSFVLSLAAVSHESKWVAFDILSMYCLNDKEKWRYCKQTFSTFAKDLSLNNKNRQIRLEMHHWQTMVNHLLNTEGDEFAKSVIKAIMNSCNEKMDYGDLLHYVKPVMRKIFQLYGREVWPLVADAIKNANRLMRYQLLQLFERGDRFEEKESSILTELPEDLLIEWCNGSPEIAPEFVAMATEVIMECEGDYLITPNTKYLLDNFGDDDKVLSALSANMGSFGWTGSLVPHYEMERAALETVKSHPREKVRDWVSRRIDYLDKMVEKEKLRDEESDWGIY